MRGGTAAAPGRRGRTDDRKSSSASRATKLVRNVPNCAADSNNLNVLRRRGRRSSSLRRRLPRVSARDVVAGVVAALDAERLARRQRLARQQRIRVLRSGHRARLALRVRRKRKRKPAHRVPKVTADRSGADVSGVAGRAVATAVDRRADRLLRNRARLLD
jgi:hypothetical protein